jgi:hypothetical protein
LPLDKASGKGRRSIFTGVCFINGQKNNPLLLFMMFTTDVHTP